MVIKDPIRQRVSKVKRRKKKKPPRRSLKPEKRGGGEQDTKRIIRDEA